MVLVLLSPAFGRAEPTGNYRPDLPPDALTTGCYPLPDGIVLDFPYQVRHDGDVRSAAGLHRELVLHWDELDVDDLVASLGRSLEAAGYRPEGELAWVRGEHEVRASVTPFDVPDDTVVRGQVVLTLPFAALASADPICQNPFATKRFPTEGAG